MVFGGEQTGSSTYIYHILMIAETHTHTYTLSPTHLYFSVCLSPSPLQAIQAAHVVLSWLSKHNLVISHIARRRLAFPSNPGRQGEGERGGIASSIKVCCGRQSISGLCCLHISHCHSAPSKPTTNGRWCQLPLLLPLLPLPSTTSCHPPNVINALPLHTDSARDTLS